MTGVVAGLPAQRSRRESERTVPGSRPGLLAEVLSERVGGPVPLLAALPGRWPDDAARFAVARLGTTDLALAAQQVRRAGLHLDLLGRVGPQDASALAVLAAWQPFAEPVPAHFRVLAVVPAYNEADVILGTVRDLLAQGIEVHVLDNWSTDGTPELLAPLVAAGGLTVERFPARDAPVRYEWAAILRRVEQVAAHSGADWCVLHDADERRRGPWPDRDLRASLYEVSRRGFDAVDHTVWEYHPVDDAFRPGQDLEAAMRHWSVPKVGANRTQVKAWNRPGERVDLVSSGGHEASFTGRRLFPYHFLLKHYPIRSQHHGERKVLVDRKPRFSADERRRLWHRHYDHVRAGHDFLWRPQDLLLDGPGVAESLLLERVTGDDPEVVRTVASPARALAAAALAATGLRPAYVQARRSYRIARRRNVETGGR